MAREQTKTRPLRASEKRKWRPNYQHGCENCGSKPTIPLSGLCGPCHFGEADMVAGGWWDEGKDDFTGEPTR